MLWEVLRLPRWRSGKEATCQYRRRTGRDRSSIPGSRRSLEEEMLTHSSILRWETPWTEEPGGLQSLASQKTWTQVMHTFRDTQVGSVYSHASCPVLLLAWTTEAANQTASSGCFWIPARCRFLDSAFIGFHELQ